VLYLVENKKIVLVGIPGVGKTSLLTKIVDILKNKNIQVKVISFGTLMFDLAKTNGLQDRDGLRKLPLSEQQNLQKIAAEKIATQTEDIVIIDTHAFITSTEGYYPGLPEHVLKIIKPSNFISVAAKPEEIYNRRMQDETRIRDNITLINIRKELEYQTGMISACAVITGTPVRHILNDEGKIDEAADKIIAALGL
jgi:adenylate kinase